MTFQNSSLSFPTTTKFMSTLTFNKLLCLLPLLYVGRADIVTVYECFASPASCRNHSRDVDIPNSSHVSRRSYSKRR